MKKVQMTKCHNTGSWMTYVKIQSWISSQYNYRQDNFIQLRVQHFPFAIANTYTRVTYVVTFAHQLHYHTPFDHSTWQIYSTHARIRTHTVAHRYTHHSYVANQFIQTLFSNRLCILFWFHFSSSKEENEASKMISSRCLNSVLKRSASNSCYKSTSRSHNSLIAHRNPTKRFLKPINLVIQSIESDGRTMATTAKPTLTLDSLNPNVIKMEYAVRGPLVIRAGEIEKELKQVRIWFNLKSAEIFILSFTFGPTSFSIKQSLSCCVNEWMSNTCEFGKFVFRCKLGG